ncbi:uncharacterized protein LOC120270034 isoform X2 [Dioscorea cayenensis subsp. rotundata]|uniref:Uncharacterized protein LOC120270034 isoform X2 n=1 Tax=Dioscorea cayennensis subsp. rotundata TaxID=55577 RepID=A0AB40C260_DIOCR|nr:uncharacterized protein LOC120270034 isoform X2 [Dioscorea cayenensis subsp. rotundata]
MDGLLECVEKIFPDFDAQNVVLNDELLKYKNKEGSFGRPAAKMGCTKTIDTFDPVGWWGTYGNGVPNLQRMARRILSLTSSPSGCERNWSTFEGIQTKKRNRLDATRLNNLVYVQFNSKIKEKREKVMKMGRDALLANDASKAQGWIVEGGDEDVEEEGMVGEMDSSRGSNMNFQVRELHEEDFVSDEEEDEEEVEFEPDMEGVLEGFQEEIDA